MSKMKRWLLMLVVMVIATSGVALSGTNIVQAKAKTVASKKDLSGAKIGVQLGTTGDIYCSDYEKDGSGTKVERYNKGADAIQALTQGKIDAVVIDEQPAKAFVEKNASLKILKEEFVKEDYALVLAKGDTELLKKVNSALEQLKKEGMLSKIVDNYIGTKKGTLPYNKKQVSRENGTLTVGTNAEFPPYEFYRGNRITGIDMDIMQAICDKLGMELKIQDMQFDSIITAVSTGKVNIGAAGFTVTEERKKNVNFSDSYATSKQVIIVKDTSLAGADKKQSFVSKLKQNFVQDGNYKYLLKGLGNTLLITVFAVLIGIIFGFILAMIRTNHDRNGKLKVLNTLAKIYLGVIRGTPVMVQLLIIYYVIFASVNMNKILIAIIAFGLNSAAYVAEIIRSGIMAVDDGQFEAARSLGLNYGQTMRSVIMPQAIKNILPALGNEFISLLKETSISGYIGLIDLTKGGDIIRSTTFEALLPLITVALIYLVLVLILSKGVSVLERRLRKNER